MTTTEDYSGGMDDKLTPRQRASQARRDRSRQALINACVDTEGYGYRVEDIAEAAGVSLATLYNHFETKTDLIQAAYEQVLSPLTEPIIRAVEAGVYNPPSRVIEVEQYVTSAARIATDNRGLVIELVRTWSDTFGRWEVGPISWKLVEGLKAVVAHDDFLFTDKPSTLNPWFPGIGLGDYHSIFYHMDMLLIRACEGGMSPDSLAWRVLRELLPALKTRFQSS